MSVDAQRQPSGRQPKVTPQIEMPRSEKSLWMKLTEYGKMIK